MIKTELIKFDILWLIIRFFQAFSIGVDVINGAQDAGFQ